MYPNHTPAAPSGPRVTVASVSEVRESANGNPYFVARFKAGVFGKPVARTFWGKLTDSGSVRWDRVPPQELAPLVGHDVTGEVAVEPVEILPEQFTVEETGEVVTVTSRSVVRFADETIEQAARRSGSVLLRENNPAREPVISQMDGGPTRYLAMDGVGTLPMSGDGMA